MTGAINLKVLSIRTKLAETNLDIKNILKKIGAAIKIRLSFAATFANKNQRVLDARSLRDPACRFDYCDRFLTRVVCRRSNI